MGLHTFSKEERIRRRADFLRIFRTGAKGQTENFRITLCPNRLDYRRLGVVVGKQVGPAVRRNRVKRLLREFFRLNKAVLPPSFDMVVTAKRGAANLGPGQIAGELKRILRELIPLTDRC